VDLTFEQVTFLITIVGAAVTAVWQLMAKVVIPRWLESGHDRQEHVQELETKRLLYTQLQDSWERDNIAELLRVNESFIRDTISEKLDRIERRINEKAERIEDRITILEQHATTQETRQRVLVGTIAEIYDMFSRHNPDRIEDHRTD